MEKEYVERKFLFDVNLLIYVFKLTPLILKGKGPNLYTGPWTLFDYVDTSEEK